MKQRQNYEWDEIGLRYNEERREQWDAIAKSELFSLGTYYHSRLEMIFKFLISPNQRVLELGCGKGDLLAAVRPTHGVGVDFSPCMIEKARERHPEMDFITADVHNVRINDKFDAVILSDLINDIWDVQGLFRNLRHMCSDDTRIVINTYSRLWQPILNVIRGLRLATQLKRQNWLTPADITNLLGLEGFEIIRGFSDIFLPANFPGLKVLANRYLSKLIPFRFFNLTNFLVARKSAEHNSLESAKISVVIPARNEEGNISEIFRRIPEMGSGTEMIFVEGGSSDDTYGAVQREMANNPQKKVKLLHQTGKGKGDAVRLGFSQASGDVLMILDADMTVPPEQLPRFHEALYRGKGEFINGVRLVYPMEERAMRLFNLVGNKFFSLAFSWLLGQHIKDTLCGTKVLTRSNYDKIAANRNYFGEFDPFGDFDLIFGAAKQNLKIVDLPIRYRERKFGNTSISRWRHGMILLRMVIFAAWRIKFI